MRRDQDPATPQWVVPAMRDVVQNLVHHPFSTRVECIRRLTGRRYFCDHGAQQRRGRPPVTDNLSENRANHNYNPTTVGD